MSGSEDSTENFVQRWSRRKRATKTPTPDDTEPARREPRDADTHSLTNVPPENEVPALDIAALPPIESMTATSDVRAFLAPGVPEDLTRAALRRAWVIDPTIRDFVGLAENQWDFTKPDSVPGFGSLDLTPELRRIVAGVFGDALGQSPPDYTKTEHIEQLTKTPPEWPPVTPGQTPDGAEVMRSDAPANVAISAVNPQVSLPSIPLDDQKPAQPRSTPEGIESDDR
jgi:hypothetical protein